MTTAVLDAKTQEFDVADVEYLRHGDKPLLARVFTPRGAGPYPALVEVHGGAWCLSDRLTERLRHEAMASQGIVSIALDFRSGNQDPYPASVQDINYAVRWAKSCARDLKTRPELIGLSGQSSGGHLAMLVAMRPRDPRYGAIPLPSAPTLEATVAYIAARSPISDPYARFQQAERMQRAGMIEATKIYFNPWGTIFEGNPQQILDRREAVTLVPMLIMQGALDDNVLPELQQKFAAAYRAAGGVCELTVFEDSEHEWVAKPGPQTERARAMVKAFIARQLTA